MPYILQIYITAEFIEKLEYTTQKRQSIGNWESIKSKAGYVSGETLFLPDDNRQNDTIPSVDLIIIQDTIYTQLPNTEIIGFRNYVWPWRDGLFEFKFAEEETVDIWVRFNSLFNTPERSNHKIAALQPGMAVRYKVNGKSDFTLSGRKQRTYLECDYVLQNLGLVEKIEYKDPGKIEIIKSYPEVISRVIDERRILK